MVRLHKIYTRGGDGGDTGLGDGSRCRKYDVRVDAYGTVDEANACIGLVRLHCDGVSDLGKLLALIQNDLFDVGADLCVPLGDDKSESEGGKSRLRVSSAQVLYLEGMIDSYNADLPALTSFILPSGSVLGVHLHYARTVVRRAERLVVGLSDRDDINGEVVRYLNRLSDLLFVLARGVDVGSEVLWKPGGVE